MRALIAMALAAMAGACTCHSEMQFSSWPTASDAGAAWKFRSDQLAVAEAKLLSVRENGREVQFIDRDGILWDVLPDGGVAVVADLNSVGFAPIWRQH